MGDLDYESLRIASRKQVEDTAPIDRVYSGYEDVDKVSVSEGAYKIKSHISRYGE